MNFYIVKGKIEHLKECCEMLIDSELGRTYCSLQNPTKMIIRALKSEEIHIAVDEKNKCLGFI